MTADDVVDSIVQQNDDREMLGGPCVTRSLNAEVEEVAEKVIAMRMPLGEHIQFVFALEHCPIALREQIVRHRIGHKFGEQLGMDTVPDLAGTSSFWSQTTRIINMGNFAEDGEYRVADWLTENPDKSIDGMRQINLQTGKQESVSALDYWHESMKRIQTAYAKLVAAGMPLEDARDILPLGLQHRFTWSTNLSAIMHVLSRRGCWLAQLGMWRPVIEGIVEELATKIHPTFRRLIDPPCFDSAGNFNTCAFKRENEEIVGKGEYPPCSLWLNREAPDVASVTPAQAPRYRKMQDQYAKLWRRSPITGERTEVRSA